VPEPSAGWELGIGLTILGFSRIRARSGRKLSHFAVQQRDS
jgi:hypothetical protein